MTAFALVVMLRRSFFSGWYAGSSEDREWLVRKGSVRQRRASALPKMSGFEVLDALRKRGIGLPVIFLTGYTQVEWEMQALNRGAVDFVDKARGIDVLAHRLRVVIEGLR